MAPKPPAGDALPGDVLIVLHDFSARSGDELNLRRGDRIELVEKDDEFGDGWFVGKHLNTGETGLFPEVYTTPAAKLAAAKPIKQQPATYPSPNSGSLDISPPGSSQGQPSPQYYPNSGAFAKRGNHSGNVRSASLNTHATNPVMNETLSVIEEHITDMHSPSKAYLSTRSPRPDSDFTPPVNRLSYINGHETDEEDTIEFSEGEVRNWTPIQVAEHLESLGAERSHCEVFKDQEISGDVLLEMDKDTIMLKEFELGTLGRRLTLLKKIQRFQHEVKGKSTSTPTGRQSLSGSNRSSSAGAVLPKIPNVHEPQGYSNGARQRAVSASTHDMNHNSTRRNHISQPSVSSIHSLPHHNRRHSSIEASPNLDNVRRENKVTSLHVKQGSFDQTWSMIPPPNNPIGSQPSTAGLGVSPGLMDSALLSPQSPDYGTTATSAVDLDRGYFSSNETESRKVRNLLRKRDSGSHTRAPSDGHSALRLSGVFRNPMAASTESVHETSRHSFLSTRKRRSEAKTNSVATDNMSTGDSSTQKIDSPLDSQERVSAMPASQARSSKTKSRFLGLRAISDAVTGGEKNSAKEKAISPSFKSANSVSSPTRPESSAQSVTSTTLSAGPDEKKLTPAKYVTFPISQDKSVKRKQKHETSAYLRGLEKKTPAEQIAESTYSGWMKKKSRKLGKWHSRLFVLRGCRLSYYYTEDDTEEKGLIDISYHRVLPANKDLLTGFYDTLTGSSATPVSPPGASLQTAAQIDATNHVGEIEKDNGLFIFKLVPPRAGMTKGVNFTEPKVHFFAVSSVHEGRKWMAALMKATIEHDERKLVSSTYKEKTISLNRAKELRVRPKEFEAEAEEGEAEAEEEEKDVDIEKEKLDGLGVAPNKEDEPLSKEISVGEDASLGAEVGKDGASDGWSLVNSQEGKVTEPATSQA